MDKLIEVLKNAVLKVDWTPQTKGLITDGMLDSIDIINIVSEITMTYDIEIPSEEMEEENFDSVQAIADMIKRIQEEY